MGGSDICPNGKLIDTGHDEIFWSSFRRVHGGFQDVTNGCLVDPRALLLPVQRFGYIFY